jgi:spoIIIJ-associated protein
MNEEDMIVVSNDDVVDYDDDEIIENSDNQNNKDAAGGEAAAVGEEDELRESELDEVSDAAIEVLQSILAYFDAENAEIDEYEGDDDEIILDVVGGDLAILIGRYGHTLEALQVLVSTITQKKIGRYHRVTVDVESYKHRQRQKIENVAYTAADRAVNQDRDVRLRPMNAYERRLVHMALRDDERVETHSEGEDPDRRVVVVPV